MVGMQGDIMLPLPPRRKEDTKSKANPPKPPAEPEPDIIIDEQAEETPKKNRQLLIPPHHHFIRFWRWWLTLGRNQRFAFIAALLLAFGARAIGWYNFIQPDSNPSLTFIHHKPKPKIPRTVPSPLTGLPVDPAL